MHEVIGIRTMSEPLIKLIYVMGYDFEGVELSAESGQADYRMVRLSVIEVHVAVGTGLDLSFVNQRNHTNQVNQRFRQRNCFYKKIISCLNISFLRYKME